MTKLWPFKGAFSKGQSATQCRFIFYQNFLENFYLFFDQITSFLAVIFLET